MTFPFPLSQAINPYYWGTVAFLFGTILGSFFSVIIHRVPQGKSIVWPGSHCPSCKKKLALWENTPLIGWLLVKGKCRQCKTPISPRYILLEITAGLIALALFLLFFFFPERMALDQFLGFCFLALAFLPILAIDLKHFMIPDVITLPGIVLGLALSLIPGGFTPLDSLIGFLVGGLFLWGFGAFFSFFLKKEAMGFGDVKLVAMMGALFGYPVALGSIFGGALFGTLGSFILFLATKSLQKQIPFGPYLCIGGGIFVLFPEVITWWLNLYQY